MSALGDVDITEDKVQFSVLKTEDLRQAISSELLQERQAWLREIHTSVRRLLEEHRSILLGKEHEAVLVKASQYTGVWGHGDCHPGTTVTDTRERTTPPSSGQSATKLPNLVEKEPPFMATLNGKVESNGSIAPPSEALSKSSSPLQPEAPVVQQLERPRSPLIPSPKAIEICKEELKKGNLKSPLSVEMALQDEEAQQAAPCSSAQRCKDMIVRIGHSMFFEAWSGGLILLNLVIMAIEIEYNGLELGYQIKMPGYSSQAEDMWPGAGLAFKVSHWIFSVGFIIELVIRLLVIKFSEERFFVLYRFVWIDALIVGLQLIQDICQLEANTSMMRIFRLARTVRAIKVVRKVSALEALYLIVKSIEDCIGALVWSFAVLVFIGVAVGMVFHNTLYSELEEGDYLSQTDRETLFDYFGTFQKTLLTMFELTMANWVVVCRLLTTAVSPWYGFAIVLYRCMFCFAAIHVISAVFIAQTNRAVAKDDELVIQAQEAERKLFLCKVRELFEGLDTSKDGYLTWQEFEGITDHELWRSWGAKLGLPMYDLENLFSLLADGDGRVSAEEFFDGIQRVRGNAKALDLVWLKSELMSAIQALSMQPKGLPQMKKKQMAIEANMLNGSPQLDARAKDNQHAVPQSTRLEI